MTLIIMMTIVFLANMNPVFVNEFITWVVRMIVVADTVVCILIVALFIKHYIEHR